MMENTEKDHVFTFEKPDQVNIFSFLFDKRHKESYRLSNDISVNSLIVSAPSGPYSQ